MTKPIYVTDAQTLENYRVALENAKNQPVVASTMAEFGYDKAKIDEGWKLLEETRTAFDFNNKESQETVQARADFETKKLALETQYTLDRKKAKVVFRTDSVTLKKLALDGTLPKAYINWVETMRTFYKGVEADKTLQTQLATLKITTESITQALNNIVALENARAIYLKEIGESQDSTKIKDSAFAKIDKWMIDFKAVAKIAMEDNPQLLESLGILVRS